MNCLDTVVRKIGLKGVSSKMEYLYLLILATAVLCGQVTCQQDDTVNADMTGHNMNTTSGMSHGQHNMNSTSHSGHMTMSHDGHDDNHGNGDMHGHDHGDMTTPQEVDSGPGSLQDHDSHTQSKRVTPTTLPVNYNKQDHSGHDHSGHDHSGHDDSGHDNSGLDNSVHDNDHSNQNMVTPKDHSGHSVGGGHSQHGSVEGHYGVFHMTYDTVILFSQWTTESWQHMLYSCLGIGVFAVLYEGIKALREWICVKTSDALEKRSIKSWNRISCGCHIAQVFLHMLQVLWSYLLMLVFMTFNIYLCTAVIIGAGVGYLIFRWKTPNNKYKMSDIDDHCM